MTEDFVVDNLGFIRGHILSQYRWVEKRGSCLLSVDDLIQVASIVLMKLADRWDLMMAREGQTTENTGPLFRAILKHEVKQAILKILAREQRPDRMPGYSFDRPDPEREDGDSSWAERELYRTSLRNKPDPVHWPTVHNDIVDFFSLMRQREKVLIALRHFDELPHAGIAEILGATEKTTANLTLTAEKKWLTFARNQFVEEPTPIPASRVNRPWTAPESLHLYLQNRHRKDLSEYLGYVTICFRQDSSYLNAALGRKQVISPFASQARRVMSLDTQQEFDRLRGAGHTVASIARKLDLNENVSLKYDHSRVVPYSDLPVGRRMKTI